MQPRQRFFIRTINCAEWEGNGKGWSFASLFGIETDIMAKYQAVSVFLDEGIIPHPIHRHPEEELLIPLNGSVELMRPMTDRHANQEPLLLAPSSLIYFPAAAPHSLHARGPGVCVVLGLRWKGKEKIVSGPLLESTVMNIPEVFPSPGENTPASSHTLMLQGETRYVRHLKIQHRLIAPEDRCHTHSHEHDLMLILLTGRMNTMFTEVTAPAVLFFPAGTPHWMSNSGKTPGSLLSVEFE